MLFFLAKKLFGNLTAAVTAASFALLSIGQHIQGFTANAEPFVIVFAIGGILLLLRAIESLSLLVLFCSGLVLGATVTIKHPGAAFIAFAGLYLLYNWLRVTPIERLSCLLRCALFSVAAVLPFLLTCFVFWYFGAFDKFWFWTFTYPSKYVSAVSMSEAPFIFLRAFTLISGSAYLLWLFAAVGLSAVAWDKKTRRSATFVLLFFVFSFLSVCPGFYFRPHYFILMLPAVALLVGIGTSAARENLGRLKSFPEAGKLPIFLIAVALFHTCYKQRDYMFSMAPDQVIRSTFRYNPFAESVEIAKYIEQHTDSDDTIGILGSEAQICFYSKRRLANAHLAMYPVVAPHIHSRQMQEEVISLIEEAKPKYLIFFNILMSWLPQKNSEMLIFEWFEDYHKKYYKRVGVIDILSPEWTVYKWNEKSISYSPRSEFWLGVYRRKD
jgi:hypothetical protein